MYRIKFTTPGGNHADYSIGQDDQGCWRICAYLHGFGTNYQTIADSFDEAVTFALGEVDSLAAMVKGGDAD